MSTSGDVASAIVQAIEPGIQDWTVHKADPVFMNLFTTSKEVVKSGFGPGYVSRRVYQDGLSGAAWYTDALGAAEANVTASTVGYAAAAVYPGLDEYRDATTFQRTLAITRLVGNLILPLDVLRANALDSAVGDIVGKRISSEAKRISHMRTNFMYADTDNSLGSVASITAGGTTSDSTATITLTRVRARQLPGGMPIEIWASDLTSRKHSAGSPISTTKAICQVVSYDTRTETLKLSLLNSATWSADLAAGDKIFMQNPSTDAGTDMSGGNRFNLPFGLFDQIKESGTIWSEGGQSGIDLAVRPNFSSLAVDSGNVFLTEDQLHKDYGAFDDRYSGIDGAEVDTALTTNGVMVGLLNNQAGSETRDRNGFTRKAKMGWTVFSFTYGGREVDIQISRSLPKGTFVSFKTADGNFKEFVPPGLAREREDGSKIPGVKFVNPELGYPDIFSPLLTTSGATTEFKQAPFGVYTQVAFDQPMGIIRTNIKEDLSS